MKKENCLTLNNIAAIIALLLFALLLFALLLTGCHIHKYVDGVCDCGSFDEKWLKQNFNMEEEVNHIEINIDQDFTDDEICVVLRNSRTYPILNERHFLLNENVILEHLFNEPKRDSRYTDDEWEKYLNNYHQMVIIHIEPQGKEHIIELIKQIEKLPFVLAAEPNYLDYPD